MVQNIGVVGAGTMGSGIAQTCAVNGLSVVMHDMSNDLLEKGLKTIEHSLDRLVAREKLSNSDKSEALARIHCSTELDALSESGLVVEAATENMDI